MKKIRVTRTEVMEFEPNPEWYSEHETLTIEEMLKMEKENLKSISNDEYFDMDDYLVKDEVKFEIVD